MARSRPLAVAAVAAALLLVVVTVDAAMNRTLAVDVREPDGAWRTLAVDSETERPEARPFPFDGGAPLEVGANDTLAFRLRVENGYAWPYRETYRVFAGGVIVAEGNVDAPARGGDAAEFTIPVDRLVAPGAKGGPTGQAPPSPYPASFEVRVGETWLYASVPLEVAG